MNLPINPRLVDVPVANLADLVEGQPGVAYSGQGGLLQTVSIRGISGQRVANFFGDIPILSERRAGTASSFIDPLMLNSAEIVRGPASVYYGSGAVAGVLQLQPANPQGLEAQLQWGSAGNENLQYLAYGEESFSLALSRRAADNSDAADGTPLNTRFEQVNTQLLWDFTLGGRRVALNTLYSAGENIGKSNSRYPDTRITEYPRQRHWLAQLSSELAAGLDASAFYHQQSLDTRVDYPQEKTGEVENSARDWGFHLDFDSAALPLRFGLDYLGRRDVDSEESETALGLAPAPSIKTLNAEQDSLDFYTDTVHGWGRAELSAGLRWSFISQQARGFSEEKDNAPSLFLRGTYEGTRHLLFSLELASGVRFPSLSERFFSGTTGRGQVLGNPDLEPEETLSVDLGLTWRTDTITAEIHAYSTRIDDYIERVDVGPDQRTFVNLSRGEILGTDAAVQLQLDDNFSLRAGAHYITGEDDDGITLADIAAPRIDAGLDYRRDNWRASLNYDYRFQQSDVAPSEQTIERVALVSASVGREWKGGWKIDLWGRNLLNQSYRVSGDSISPLGAERSVGVSLSWYGPGAGRQAGL